MYYRHGPSEPLLKNIKNRPPPKGVSTFRDRIGDLTTSEQENMAPTTRDKTRSWREDHQTADDAELRLENPDSDGDGSEDEGPSRGHIAPQKFGPKVNGKTRKQSPNEDSEDSSHTKRRKISAQSSRTNTNGDLGARATSGSKKNASTHEAIFGNKVKNTYGSGNARNGVKSEHGVGASFSSSASSQRMSSRKVKVEADSQDSKRGRQKSSSKACPIGDSFQDVSSPPPSETKPRPRMEHLPSDDEIPSPEPLPKFQKFGSPIKDKHRPKEEFLRFSDSEEEKPRPKRRGRKKKQQQKSPTPPSRTQFIDFNDDVDFNNQVEQADLDNFDFPATQFGSGFIDPMTVLPDEDEEDEKEEQAKEAPCPWCKKPVSTQDLTSFSKGQRLNVRLQQKFCRQHNKQTALALYAAKDYPTIHWDDLPSRIDSHADSLLPVINDTTPSHYRARLAEKIASGKDRAMKNSSDDIQPGYYGPMGFTIMCEVLVQKWGKLLKEKAPKDRVISGRGSAYFIQSVLAAELACRLVSEDMGVGLEEARKILEESREIGELLHEDD